MSSIFTRIINGELPGRFVWQDDAVAAFLTINPINPGHTLVVPRQEVDHWIDLPSDVAGQVFAVAHTLGRAIDRAFSASRVGVIVAGLEVPHAHIHLVPFDREAELDFSRADPSPDGADLDNAASRIITALSELGADSGA